MAENTQQTTLVYKVDEASISNAQSRLAALDKQQATFSAALLKGDIDADKYAKSIGRLAKEQATLETALKKTETAEKAVADEFERLKRAADIDKVVADAKALEKKTKDTSAAVKQLTADLKKMGATDIEARGAVGSFQQGNAYKKGLLGEIGTQVKNAPAIPLPGLGITTEPISKAAIALDRFKENLGTSTQAIIGAGIAFAALAVALAVGQKLAEDNTRFAQASVAALQNVNDLQNASTQSLIASTKEYSQVLNNNQADLDATKKKLTEFESALDQTSLRGAAELGNVVGVAGTELGVLRDSITELSNQSVEAQANLDTAIQVLRERGFSEQEILEITKAATEQELALAAARSKGVLAAGQEAASLEQAKQQTEGKTKEELQALIAAEADRVAVLQAELAILQSSGDQSKEVTDRIAALQSQLELSAQKSDIFKDSINGAMTDAQKSAADTAKKLQEEAKANSTLGQSATTAINGLRTLGQGLSNVGAGTKKPGGFNILSSYRPLANTAADKAADDAKKAAEDYQKKLTDINRDLAITFNDIGRDLQDSLEDLRIDTRRDIRDALAEGEFLSIGDIQRKAKDDRADLEREAARDRRDAQIKANQELLDLQAQFWQASISMAQGAVARIGGGTANKGSFVTISPRS